MYFETASREFFYKTQVIKGYLNGFLITRLQHIQYLVCIQAFIQQVLSGLNRTGIFLTTGHPIESFVTDQDLVPFQTVDNLFVGGIQRNNDTSGSMNIGIKEVVIELKTSKSDGCEYEYCTDNNPFVQSWKQHKPVLLDYIH